MPEVQANDVCLYYEEHGTGAAIVCMLGLLLVVTLVAAAFRNPVK